MRLVPAPRAPEELSTLLRAECEGILYLRHFPGCSTPSPFDAAEPVHTEHTEHPSDRVRVGVGLYDVVIPQDANLGPTSLS